MVDRAFVAMQAPLDTVAVSFCGDADTILDARFDLAAFLVVVPSHELHTGKLRILAVIFADLVERVEPGMAALLIDDTIRAPSRLLIVEAFVSATDDGLVPVLQTGGVERIEVVLSPVARISRRNVHPAESAIGLRIVESHCVAEDEHRVVGNTAADGIPIDTELLEPEEEYCRAAVDLHVCRRSLVMLGYIIKVGNYLLG